MLSSIPAFRLRAAACPFLLAFVLSGANVPAAAKAALPQRIEELDTKAAARLLIHVAKPNYPTIAKVNFVQGSVKLQIKVTAKGQVSEAHVLDGEAILAVAALEAVQKWLYKPYRSPEGPAPFITFVVVRFNLHPHRFRGRFPQDADGYLEKQIRPPEIISRPQRDPSPRSIPMKVLVGAKGEVLDATSPEAREPEVELARKSLRLWKFRPAQWGAIAIPWYLMVRVPIDRVSMKEVADSAKH
jgi:TonB family protein